MHSFSFEAIGTSWTIDITKKSILLEKKIYQLVNGFDSTYSRFKADSYISRISKVKGIYEAPADFEALWDIYSKLYTLTDGLFTPLIGSLLEDAGYDRNYSLVPKKLRPVDSLEVSMKFEAKNIEILKPSTFDFGAAGKGYLVDKVAELLEKEGVSRFTIDAGGDIFVKSEKLVRIALEHPEDTKKAIGVAEISNKSICSSSGNRRKWDKFHHIVNPKTLTSSDEVLATWVVSKKTIASDALATALMLLPKPERYRDFKFEYVILYKDYSAIKSNNFPGEIFTK